MTEQNVIPNGTQNGSGELLAWHFVDEALRDGQPLPPDGEKLTHGAAPSLCVSGLHASERIIDALKYAPGNTICRVECEDLATRQDDKLVCATRTVLWRVDGEELLREFARKVALDVADGTVGTGVGSAGPTPFRAQEAEQFAAERLGGHWDASEPADPGVLREFGRLVAAAASPIDDVRGTADYRRHALSVLAARCLGWAWSERPLEQAA